MPELPEVETVRRGLLSIIGSTVTNAQVFRERSVRMHDGGAATFLCDIGGMAITAAVRRGKFLWLPLSSFRAQSQNLEGVNSALLIHLGMSGQLRLNPIGTEVHPHLRVRLELETATGSRQRLDFIDQRTFGHLALVDLVPTLDGLPGGEGSSLSLIPVPAAHIARDILDPHLDTSSCITKVKSKNSEIKRVLLDQTVLSGIGNIYADEALWHAKIHPQTISAKLSKPKIKLLLTAAQEIITNSLRVGGTSFDNLYVNVNGESGNNSDNLNVYGRENEPCPRCGHAIKRITFMNRSSHLCPNCQRR